MDYRILNTEEDNAVIVLAPINAETDAAYLMRSGKIAARLGAYARIMLPVFLPVALQKYGVALAA